MAVELTGGLWWLDECHALDDGTHEHVAVYCIEHDGRFVLVDSGSFHHREAVLAGIEAVTGGAGIDALVLSHTDYPHAANLGALRERWGEYELVASSGAPEIQGLPPSARRCTVGASMEVQGRELGFVDPPLADRSHTTWIHDPETGTLFTADGFGARHRPGECGRTSAELDGISTERVREYHAETLVWLRYADPDAIRRAIERVFDAHEVERVAPIHGPPIVGDDIGRYLSAFHEAVEDIADEDPTTLYPESATHD